MRQAYGASIYLTLALCVAGLGTGVGCRSRSSDVVELHGVIAYGGIDKPITSERLLSGNFVAYSALWAVTVPGGDPVRFLPDGRLENRAAGLVGPWAVLDDSTVQIGRHVFHHRAAEGDLFAPIRPLPRDSTLPRGANVVGTRIVAAPR